MNLTESTDALNKIKNLYLQKKELLLEKISEEQTNEADFLAKNPSMIRLIGDFTEKINPPILSGKTQEIHSNSEEKEPVKLNSSEKTEENHSNIGEKEAFKTNAEKQRERASGNFFKKYVKPFYSLE